MTLSTVCCSLRGNCLPLPPPFQVENKLQVVAWSWSSLPYGRRCGMQAGADRMGRKGKQRQGTEFCM